MQDFNEYYENQHLPVCLNKDNRLEFMQDSVMVLSLPGGTLLRLTELSGSSWDGATIPKWFWCLIGHPLDYSFRWASFWHDRFCEFATTYEERRFADAVFLYLLSKAGVSKPKRMLMWLAVRLYGLVVWKPKVRLP